MRLKFIVGRLGMAGCMVVFAAKVAESGMFGWREGVFFTAFFLIGVFFVWLGWTGIRP